jgi:acid phosphatase
MNRTKFSAFLILALIGFALFSCKTGENTTPRYELLQSVLYTQTAAEHRALILQTYHWAQVQLDAALADKNWSAAVEQSDAFQNLPPAVILDVDETVLDNSPYEAQLIQNGTTYNSKTWNAWCEQSRAKAIPGAVEFCTYARQKGVTVFYVTNRRARLLEATRRNLKAAGFPLEASMEAILPRTDSSNKGARRKAIAQKYRILLLIGDNAGDCFSGFTHASTVKRDSLVSIYQSYWGTKWIVLPNPMYGDWESALYSYNYGLPPADKLKLKLSRLKK